MAITKSNSAECLDASNEYAIGIYLREGETIELMLKKFKGNKTLLVMFFREREFEQYEGNTYKPDIKRAEQWMKEELVRLAEERQEHLIKIAAQPVKKKRAGKK